MEQIKETVNELRLEYDLKRSELMQLDRKISYYFRRLNNAEIQSNTDQQKRVSKILIKLGKRFEKLSNNCWHIQNKLTHLKIQSNDNDKN